MSIRQHDFTIERRCRQRWFGVPAGWTDTEWSLDFRLGGGELNAGHHPRGNHHLFRSRFHDIVEGERIVFAYDMLLDGRLTSVSLTTIELRPGDSGGTHLIFTEHGAFLDDLEEPAEREHGTGLLLDALEAFLAGEVPA